MWSVIMCNGFTHILTPRGIFLESLVTLHAFVLAQVDYDSLMQLEIPGVLTWIKAQIYSEEMKGIIALKSSTNLD